ncbi:MAG TPA: bifunctional 3-(3-hydroxy-phenyl)propionate/3-hydroxycinnamic acid hydroxylase [Pseudonocardiaceae bacterium]|nr:bifunctional 3-(3-hydroxy-phenyl)propionate/3-hydroxycinnamic acid hydroxylase [Pseudonocardiaceae bacterium]
MNGTTETDVLIIGDGPVGQTLGILLARQGWPVTVVDKWPAAFSISRAVAFDSEAARILCTAGIRDFVADDTEPSGTYCWENAAGETLLRIEGNQRGWCHWPDSTSMFQPGLEAALAQRGTELPSLRVLRGHEAVDIVEHDSHVDVDIVNQRQERQTISARWVIGCDGANSFVRQRIGTEMQDLRFSHDWLICDVVLDDPHPFEPNNLQVCDPDRPRTAASAGPGHRRWEFMRVGGESVEDLDTPESAWRLLALFDVTPDNATLLRHAVYTFRARWADQWRRNRLLIAGDAAHLMPPFAGQGMCSGIRDAANLAWKLDLVLRGQADDTLLDTYEQERRAHVPHAVKMSVDLGKVICQLDPKAARDRDMVMGAARKRGVGAGKADAPVHPLKTGLLQTDRDGVAPRWPAGDLSPQGRVSGEGRTDLFDDVVGRGFTLITTVDPAELLDADSVDFLTGIGGHVVQVLPAGSEDHDRAGTVVDVDDVYLPYLADKGARAMLVRPDMYVFGAARDRADCVALVNDMRERTFAKESVAV